MQCGPPYGKKNWPSAPELAQLPNVLPLPGMAMRDAKWWDATMALVAANLDAVVRKTPLTHVVRPPAKSSHECADALAANCLGARRVSLGNCFVCSGSPRVARKLEAADCQQDDIQKFCESKRS